MPLRQFLTDGRLKSHRTTPKEIQDLLRVVDRNVLPELLGPQIQDLADYFDQCRGKRNLSDYDRAGEIAEDEAVEVLRETKKFRATVLNWLKERHPGLIPK